MIEKYENMWLSGIPETLVDAVNMSTHLVGTVNMMPAFIRVIDASDEEVDIKAVYHKDDIHPRTASKHDFGEAEYIMFDSDMSASTLQFLISEDLLQETDESELPEYIEGEQ